jgi:hypothetical protein
MSRLLRYFRVFGWLLLSVDRGWCHRYRSGGLSGRRWNLLADLLAIIVADHYHEEFGFLCRDELAHHLRPFTVAASAVADQTGIGAVLANHDNFGGLRKRIFKAVRKPIGVCVA